MPTEDAKPVVLLIDDSVDVHRLLRARLRHEHLTLAALASGAEAIKSLHTLKTISPAAILLDLDMPSMDGFEVLRRLKEHPATNTIPVIVLSGMVGAEDKVAAFDLGAADYITKPFDLAELRARLRAAMRLNHLLKLLAERADVDGLTGLGNRSHFDKRWAEKVSECHRYGKPLSLALLDVDHFKRVNDTYGHPAGDELLQGLAGLLLCECRKPDVPCRYGGEEFALIMPNTGPSDATAVAERIRAAIAERVWPRHPESTITASIGVVGTDGPLAPLSAEAWIEAADRNLYTAKRTGRNQVIATNLAAPGRGLAQAG